jgi:hypothetical protein
MDALRIWFRVSFACVPAFRVMVFCLLVMIGFQFLLWLQFNAPEMQLR